MSSKSGVIQGVTLCNLLREVPKFRRDFLLLIQGKIVSDATASSERTVHIYEVTVHYITHQKTAPRGLQMEQISAVASKNQTCR